MRLSIGNPKRTARAFLGRPETRLFLTSFLGLYAELLCIRWMPAHVRYLSYFTNFILLASFLGLGAGILSARRRLPLGLGVFPWLLLGIVVLVAVSKHELVIGSVGVLYYGAGEGGPFPPENALVLPAAFLLVALLFVCVGRPLGQLLLEVRPPLRAYGFDIGGSLAGIGAFFLLALTEQPPGVWFGGLLLIVLLLAERPSTRSLAAVPLVSSLLIAGAIGSSLWWSPYYKIGLTPIPPGADQSLGWMLNVNDSGQQALLPADHKEPFYHKPYELVGPRTFQRALIVGAGSGSDTAIALLNGVGNVDAVEIDPIIARLGRLYHPDQPFSDPRVVVHVDDGRAFFRKTNERFDLIIFALPDSLTLTSQFASLRLESFLFTEEAFREARDHLTGDGWLVLYNYYREVWLLRKLAAMLETTFEQPPYVISYGGWGRAGLLVSGPRLATLVDERPELGQPYLEIRSPMPQLDEDPDAILLPVVGAGLLSTDNRAGDYDHEAPSPASDDWPLMYLRNRGLPFVYLAALGMVAATAIALVWLLTPAESRNGFNGHMFFLGAAFMLLETRSLVTFSLLFGSTWLVNSLVFFAILSSVMLAVFVSTRLPIRPSRGLYGLLLGALALAYLMPPDALLSIESAPWRYALASGIAFLPILLANLVFAGSFKLTGRAADIAFASNLLGAMVGGMLEYSALLLGYKSLLLLVMALYLASALPAILHPSTSSEPVSKFS